MGDDEYLRTLIWTEGHRRRNPPPAWSLPEYAALALLAVNLVCLYLLFR